MKKTTLILFSISVFAGMGYLVFSRSPVGKSVLIKWLLHKWKAAARQKEKTLNEKKIRSELQKLDYDELELLVAYTWSFPVLSDEVLQEESKKKRFEKRYRKLNEAGIFKKADLTPLENMIFPG